MATTRLRAVPKKAPRKRRPSELAKQFPGILYAHHQYEYGPHDRDLRGAASLDLLCDGHELPLLRRGRLIATYHLVSVDVLHVTRELKR